MFYRFSKPDCSGVLRRHVQRNIKMALQTGLTKLTVTYIQTRQMPVRGNATTYTIKRPQILTLDIFKQTVRPPHTRLTKLTPWSSPGAWRLLESRLCRLCRCVCSSSSSCSCSRVFSGCWPSPRSLKRTLNLWNQAVKPPRVLTAWRTPCWGLKRENTFLLRSCCSDLFLAPPTRRTV